MDRSDSPGRTAWLTEATIGTTWPALGLLLPSSGHELFKHDSRNHPLPYQVEHDELSGAIARSQYPYAEDENGAKATMTSILGRMATYSGQVVEWKDAIASNLSLMPQQFDFKAQPPVLPGADGMYACAVPGVTKVI